MKFSVIIPVYNEPAGLQITLDSLLNQSYDQHEYEVIVVDNGSKDQTLAVADSYAKKYPTQVLVEKEHELQGSYAARNKGISIAKGEIFCFIDADMTVERDYLKKMDAFFQEHKPDYVGCRVVVYSDKNTLAAKFNQLNGFKVESELKSSQYAPTCCLSVKRDIFEKVGLFDYRLESGGDYEFGQRVYRKGLVQKYANDIQLLHPARWKYTSLKNKSKRVARGICQLAMHYPDLYQKNLKKYFRIKRHFPKNPLAIMRTARRMNVNLNYWQIIILAFYHVPLTFSSSAEVRRFLKENDKKAH